MGHEMMLHHMVHIYINLIYMSLEGYIYMWAVEQIAKIDKMSYSNILSLNYVC